MTDKYKGPNETGVEWWQRVYGTKQPSPNVADRSDADLAWWALFDSRSTRLQVFGELLARHLDGGPINKLAKAGLNVGDNVKPEYTYENRTMCIYAILAHVDLERFANYIQGTLIEYDQSQGN